VLLACSPDGRLLAACAYEPGALTATLLLFHAGTLEPYMRIETDVAAFTQIAFDPAATELMGVTKVGRKCFMPPMMPTPRESRNTKPC